jgi:hypothetical protein
MPFPAHPHPQQGENPKAQNDPQEPSKGHPVVIILRRGWHERCWSQKTSGDQLAAASHHLVFKEEARVFLFLSVFCRDLLLALRSSRGHNTRNLAEDGADAAGNTRHNGARGNRDKTGHQCVLNEVLASSVLPDSQLPYQIRDSCHFFLASNLNGTFVPGPKLSSKDGIRNEGDALDNPKKPLVNGRCLL